MRRLCSLIVIAALLTMSFPAMAQDNKRLIIATATTGGTYYPVGVGIGTLVSLKLAKKDGITATAINSAGSGENIEMLKNKEAHFAILQSLFGLQASRGMGFYEGKPVDSFRSITMLWPNVEHFAIMSKYAKTGTVADIGALSDRFSIGKRGSGTEGSGRALLKALNINANDLKLEFLGYTPSTQAMLDNRIAGANIPAGVPAAAITQLFAMSHGKATVLDFSDEQLTTIQKNFPIWYRYVIPANTYPGQAKDIRTIAQPNFLAVRADMPEDVVYKVTKTIYENLNFLGTIHSATKNMSLDSALSGLPVALHPGAAKYYREVGIEIPERLIAK
ncbi:TAXI family TRAP transporter solute-binding subunit [Halodesulfovibrio spirochaetisodalis]|uniref:C4-dicarboxylate ABC transporter substrate-binding protein n=1 Tax=Halodesulfovibrio spirochaetisodalis TaxID=1560234 RepID=A0A1B7XDG8_9BACT|nr:TAXI family TRAP transporter solute-binding subunit [Halodesulfovibrio spirochaetisodalis]OBQ52102.1 C4-dicarboxylate ABC transporter substrate-binding protein [Halodesulfovibrio spirochaetisodalis]